MKEIKKTTLKEQVSYLWQAEDGTQFPTREECEEYEQSVIGAVMLRLHPVRVLTEEQLFRASGSDEWNVYVIQVDTEEVRNSLLQIIAIDCNKNEEQSDYQKKAQDRAVQLVDRAYKTQDYLFLGRNMYEKCHFYIYDTLAGFKEHFASLTFPEAVPTDSQSTNEN